MLSLIIKLKMKVTTAFLWGEYKKNIAIPIYEILVPRRGEEKARGSLRAHARNIPYTFTEHVRGSSKQICGIAFTRARLVSAAAYAQG